MTVKRSLNELENAGADHAGAAESRRTELHICLSTAQVKYILAATDFCAVYTLRQY